MEPNKKPCAPSIQDDPALAAALAQSDSESDTLDDEGVQYYMSGSGFNFAVQGNPSPMAFALASMLENRLAERLAEKGKGKGKGKGNAAQAANPQDNVGDTSTHEDQANVGDTSTHDYQGNVGDTSTHGYQGNIGDTSTHDYQGNVGGNSTSTAAKNGTPKKEAKKKAKKTKKDH